MQWKISKNPVEYEDAIAWMEARVAAIRAGSEPECIWLLEHPALYTAGSSANPKDLLGTHPFPVYPTGRGGQYTYHGPGQRIAYIMLDLRKHEPDIREFVKTLERWIIATLAEFNVQGAVREGRIGVWVNLPGGSEAKIAALGIRVRNGVSYHGISLNVNPDLTHYSGIVPCGISDYGVTSLAALGIDASMEHVDAALKKCWNV